MLRHTIRFIIAAAAGSAALSGCVHSPAPPMIVEKPSDEQPVLYDVANNRINLPADTSLEAISVSGRDLLVRLTDGSVRVIVNGAIVVPEIWIGDIVVGSANLAALLLDEEPRPAAGGPQQPPSANGHDPGISPGGGPDTQPPPPRNGGHATRGDRDGPRRTRAIRHARPPSGGARGGEQAAFATEGFEGDFDCLIQGNVVGVPDGATCDLIKQKLSRGCISFRPSETMLRGVATDVSVALKRGGSCEADVQAAIRRGDASDASIAAERIFTTQLMTAELDGSRLHFDIQRSDNKDPLRNTNNDPVPVWSWKVTPKLASPPGGYWTLKARIGLFVRDLDGNLKQVPGVWQPHNIKVEVKLRDKVADFLAEVAAWITTPVGAITALATLVTAIAALLAALRKLRKKQNTAPQPGSPSTTAPSAAPAPTSAAST